MITYTTVNSKTDLEGILKLQKSNLAQNLNSDEIRSQGFVTVNHTYDLLKKLNDFEKHIIAKENDKVIGYVLAMTKHSKFDIPVLFPMFNVFDTVLFKDKKISAYNYILVGQVCVDKAYRGQGIFNNCYAAYKEFYKDKYDFAITEIANTNSRSLNAHKRIGFEDIHSYFAPDKTEWIVVLWNWKNGK
jgi:GNAT superfamily N-acetyltransferase